MNPALQQLFAQRSDIWRNRDRRFAASHVATNRAHNQTTGFAALDSELHGSGWPRGALTELLLTQPGSGELFLLTPLLAEVSHRRLLHVWINPPFIPYAPALLQRGIALDSLLLVRGEPQHHLWACEQALRSTACGAVLYWPGKQLRYAELRKLQVAAAAQSATGFLFRDTRTARQTSPAALRMQLNTVDTQLSIQILKQRGRAAGQRVLLPREQTLQATVPFNATQSPQRIVRLAPARAHTTPPSAVHTAPVATALR
ncbi:MAG TPA: translesion DNA synthesis-associated protein ImuA [Spongiibacteraceae bacterium]|nr:translesion DNA synthesis-associated protein ImuA [Spongiibacteraceae bacterium]